MKYDASDDRVEPHLAAIAAIDELTARVRDIERRGSMAPEELRSLVLEVGSFRGAGRVDDLIEVVGHSMAIAEAMGWRRLRAEFANIQGMNYLLQGRLEWAGRLFDEAARVWAEGALPQRRDAA